MKIIGLTQKIKASHNSGLAKVAVQLLIEHLCFKSSSVVAKNFVALNQPLISSCKSLCAVRAGCKLQPTGMKIDN
jgi:hypothetical protein